MARPKKKELTRKQLIKKVKKNKSIINKRLARLERESKKTGIKSEFAENQIEKFKAMTGTKSNKKVGTGNLSRYSMKKIQDIFANQQLFLKSAHSTLSGQKKILSKQMQTLRNKGFNLNKKQFNVFVKMMDNRTLNELREKKYLDSWQMLELAQESKIKNITDGINYLIDNIDYSKMQAFEIRDFLLAYINNDEKVIEEFETKFSL